MKVSYKKLIIRGIAFLLIFCVLLSLLTLILLPNKDHTTESTQVRGFYEEPEDTVDVLFLGSCNMYSSISPVLLYEEYGITGYAMCCPDQEMSTSYYYIKEALKSQKIKTVCIESLFFTNTNGASREHYNRFALDYMPLSLNKIKLASVVAKSEAELMKKYDPTAPDELLTFFTYIFPALRYHGRTDFSFDDITFFFKTNFYNFYKGGFPQYNYTTNDGNYYSKVFNGDCINETTRKYFPMIKKLCEENDINLMIAKSPNPARWGYDDAYNNIVKDYAEQMGVKFLNYSDKEHFNFEEYDYGYSTGRLNIYGVQKFSHTMGQFLIDNFNMQPTKLGEIDKKAWEGCIDKYYKVAKEKGCSIYEGQIAQLSNTEDAVCVRWNTVPDCRKYDVFRKIEKGGEFQKIGTAEGNLFYDKDVKNTTGYTYYIVPQEGKLKGVKSESSYTIFVEMPKNIEIKLKEGKPYITWDANEKCTKYDLSRRTFDGFNFEWYDSMEPFQTSYCNVSAEKDTTYYYRMCAVIEKDGKTFQSETKVVSIIPTE